MNNSIITLIPFVMMPRVAVSQETLSDSAQRAELQIILRPVVESAKSFILNRHQFHPCGLDQETALRPPTQPGI